MSVNFKRMLNHFPQFREKTPDEFISAYNAV